MTRSEVSKAVWARPGYREFWRAARSGRRPVVMTRDYFMDVAQCQTFIREHEATWPPLGGFKALAINEGWDNPTPRQRREIRERLVLRWGSKWKEHA